MTRPLTLAVLALAMALPAGIASAKDHGKTHKTTSAHGCPPGLAKKSSACLPPGQARKLDQRTTPRDDAIRTDSTTVTTTRRDITHRETTATGQVTSETRSVTEVVTRDGRVLRIGDRVEEDYTARYVLLDEPERFDLPPLDPGHRYIRANRSAMVIDEQTREILELIRLAAVLID